MEKYLSEVTRETMIPAISKKLAPRETDSSGAMKLLRKEIN